MNSSKCWPDNPFWEFSLDFYGRKGVSERLISLQEDLQVDVNLMLYCYWSAYIGAPILGESKISRALNLVSEWQKDVVIPLRGLRLKLKNNHIYKKWIRSHEVRNKVKMAELEAERVEQLMLYNEHSFSGDAGVEIEEKRKRAIVNVASYLSYLDKKPSFENQIILDQLLELLFHEC